ncbi:hypothetical protein [Vibrio cholerae]|uniref:hypothetical protein n=3 Tax=Vibrio cholerae TaxID=666 RepID=UPI00226E5DCE|nr:hypothetical protein [Vibrio cholerae]EJX7572574.1 hypothetical protein [Vibrio cholerae]HDV5527321.1 hypothetical protein [Vibrio cholerae]
MMKLSASDCEQFKLILRELDVEVPPRGQSRTTEACESWILHKALLAFHQKKMISYPIVIEKMEKPDFWIMSANKTYGVELTEAVNPDYARIQTLPEASIQGSVIDPSLFKWGCEERNTQELRDIALQTELTGDGWVGDNVEREFTQSIFDIVKRKDKKLKGHYRRADIDILLIYHNQTSPDLRINSALSYTEARLAEYWSEGFDLVCVVKDEHLMVFCKESSLLIAFES